MRKVEFVWNQYLKYLKTLAEIQLKLQSKRLRQGGEETNSFTILLSEGTVIVKKSAHNQLKF